MSPNYFITGHYSPKKMKTYLIQYFREIDCDGENREKGRIGERVKREEAEEKWRRRGNRGDRLQEKEEAEEEKEIEEEEEVERRELGYTVILTERSQTVDQLWPEWWWMDYK